MSGRGNCDEFYELSHRAAEGPRGGRVWFAWGVCLRCRRTTVERRTKRPGTIDMDTHRDIENDLALRPCTNPYRHTPAAKLLYDLADIVKKRERIPFSFALEHLPDKRSLRDATVKAWRQCDDGYAMGRLLESVHLNVGRAHAARAQDGSEVRVGVDLGDVHANLRGKSGAIATSLRLLMSDAAIGQIADVMERHAKGDVDPPAH